MKRIRSNTVINVEHRMKQTRKEKRERITSCMSCDIRFSYDDNIAPIFCKKCRLKRDSQEKFIELFFKKFDDIHNAVALATRKKAGASEKSRKRLEIINRQFALFAKKQL